MQTFFLKPTLTKKPYVVPIYRYFSTRSMFNEEDIVHLLRGGGPHRFQYPTFLSGLLELHLHFLSKLPK